MKRIGSTNMKIIAATAMTVFSLFAATVGVFAWFTGKIQDSKNADEFEVTINSGRFKNLYFHQYSSVVTDSTSLKPISYTFNSSWAGKISYDWNTGTASYTGTAVEMEDYSPLDFSQPVLLVFELNDAYELTNAGEISIEAKTDVEGFLGARTSTGTPVYNLLNSALSHDTSTDTYYYALSSVINFYCTDTSSELYNKNGNDNTTLINTTYTVANLKNKEDCKAAKESNPAAVVPDLTFTYIDNDTDEVTFNQEPSLYKSEANTTVRYISIIIDYYSDALDYIYSTYLGDRTLEGPFDYHLNFKCDWGLEIN